MKYEILLRPSYSALRCLLASGEEIRTESGAMLAMDASAEIQGKVEGGFFSGLKRAILTNESFFVTTIRATQNDTEVLLAPRTTGDIEVIELSGDEYLVQGGSFLAASTGIETDAKFTGWKGFVSGDGIFMIKARGKGQLFLSSFGGILPKTLNPGQRYICDNGHLVAYSASMTYEIARAGTGFGMITTGEGLVTTFTGPGTIFLQTRNLRSFAETLNPFLPDRQKSQGRGFLGQVMGG